MKLLPFDLQRALAGDKVVTRDGREVTQLQKFDCDSEYCLVGIFEGQIESWTHTGRYIENKKELSLNLFMAPKTVKRWVNFYKNERATHYETENEAKEHADTFLAIAIAVPVEFEEGYGCE